MQRIKLEPHLTSYIKINSICTKYLNVRAKTVRLSEENTEVNFHDFGLGNDFSEKKLNKLDFIKKDFNTSKGIIRQMKRKLVGWNFANHRSDKALVARIYEEPLQLNNKKANNPS